MPIDRTNKTALDANLVNGITSDAPKVKNNNDTIYNFVDGLEAAQNSHANNPTLAHPDGSVTGPKLRDGAVTKPKIADGAVTPQKIANGAVGAAQLSASLLAQYGDIAIQAEFDKRRVNVQKFGAKGDGVTDDRESIENTLDYINSVGGGTLFFPPGTYLVNSLSHNTALATAWGQIFPLYSNLKIELHPDAEIVVGTFFDDKKFILFNGYNAVAEGDSTTLQNIWVEGGTISFSGSSSMMRTVPLKRVAFVTGKSTYTLFDNITFKDGDLRNCIIAGYGSGCAYHTVRNCRFIDLVQDGVNNDYTACYCDAKYTQVVDCHFSNSSRKGWEIACCVELHQSNSVWRGGSVKKHTRGCFLVSGITETTLTSGLEVTGITGEVTNDLVNLWCDNGCVLENIDIHDNTITAMTRDGTMTNTAIYGCSTLMTTSGGKSSEGALSRNIRIHSNTLIVPNDGRVASLSSGLAINNNSTHVSKLKFYDNTLSVKQFIYTTGCDNFDLVGLYVKNNTFDSDIMDSAGPFALFTLKSLADCYLDFSLQKPVSRDYLLRIIVSTAGSNNTVIIHPENTSSVLTPFLATEVFRSAAKMEYPATSNMTVASSTGVFAASTTMDSYIKRAVMLNHGNLPIGIYTSGTFYIGADSALRTIVSVAVAAGGTYGIRILASNLN